jgi:signal transduction histidine kinase
MIVRTWPSASFGGDMSESSQPGAKAGAPPSDGERARSNRALVATWMVTTSGGRRAAAEKDFRSALEEERIENSRRINVLRLWGVSAFFALYLVLGGVLQIRAWQGNLGIFAVYWLVTAAIFVVSRKRVDAARLASLGIAFVDMPVVFFLQYATFPTSNTVQGVAGFTVGIYAFLVFLAALSLERWKIYVTAASGAFWEGLLQYLAGVVPEAIVASAILMTLSASTCAYASRRLAELIGRVAREAAELRRAQEIVHRQEKLAAVGQLAAEVAHDLRNPLWAVRNTFYWLKKRLSEGEPPAEPRVEKALELIENELRACSSIIDELLDFARERPLELCLTPMRELVADALAIVRVPNGVTLQNQVPTQLPEIELDPTQFRQVLVNLAQNAVDALPEERGGTVSVRAKIAGGRLVLTVDDDGVGIAPSVLPRIFEPLFTTRPKGTGLGLAIVAAIVKRHRGTISVKSEPDEGTHFEIAMEARQRGPSRSST